MHTVIISLEWQLAACFWPTVDLYLFIFIFSSTVCPKETGQHMKSLVWTRVWTFRNQNHVCRTAAVRILHKHRSWFVGHYSADIKPPSVQTIYMLWCEYWWLFCLFYFVWATECNFVWNIVIIHIHVTVIHTMSITRFIFLIAKKRNVFIVAVREDQRV